MADSSNHNEPASVGGNQVDTLIEFLDRSRRAYAYEHEAMSEAEFSSFLGGLLEVLNANLEGNDLVASDRNAKNSTANPPKQASAGISKEGEERNE